MSERGDKQPIRILGIDKDGRDLQRVAQSEVRPRFAAIERFVNAVADGKVGALQSLAAAYVNNVGIGRSQRDRADRAGRLIVEERLPGAAVVVRLPHAAIIHADVEDVRLCRNARRAHRSAAAEWSDITPAESRIKPSWKVLSECRTSEEGDEMAH